MSGAAPMEPMGEPLLLSVRASDWLPLKVAVGGLNLLRVSNLSWLISFTGILSETN